MLSITNISSSAKAGHYFEKDDYYAKDDPEHKEYSRWFGYGADDLGLLGQVEKADFLRILEGQLPQGTQLGRQVDGQIEHACGLDLTFSAPKSVSILSEIKGDSRIAGAHKQAVMKALRYVEANLVNTRKQVNGVLFKEKVDNIIVSMFRHNTSRALDPQLHTHCVLANVVKRHDGVWRSGEFKEIFDNKLLLGQIYRSELACSLKELGYEIKRTTKGMFEIDGISDAVLKNFSKRSAAKEEALKNYDYVNAKTAENAVLMTREKKQATSKVDLQAKWREESRVIGFDVDKAPQKMEAVQQKSPGIMSYIQDKFREFCRKFEFDANKGPEGIDVVTKESGMSLEEKAVLYAISHLSERSAVFHKRDLYRTALDCAIGDLKIEQVAEAVRKFARDRTLLFNKSKELEGTFTTKEALAKEKETVEMMKNGMEAKPSIYTKSALKENLKDSPLNKGQKEAVSLILNTKDRTVGVQGYAGTGKTFMLNVARELGEKKNYKCIGLAPSSSAASTLQKEAKIESKTLHKFLFKYRGVIEGRGTLAGREQMESDFKNKLVILDEASMASTTQMHGLLKVANELNIRLVLVGDKKQLGAIEAGKPFAQLQKAGMKTAIMEEIKRQTNSVLRDAVYDCINAVDKKNTPCIEEAVEKIGNNFITSKKGMLAQAAANKWLGLNKDDRANTLITVPSHEIRRKVNEHIREALKQEGLLSGPSEQISVLNNKNLTSAEKSRADNYQKGDQVLFHKKYKSLGLDRGKYYAIDQANKYNKVGIKNDSNKLAHWDPSKSGNRHVEVFTSSSITIQQGERIRWTRNSAAHPNIKNSETAIVLGITQKNIKLTLENGETVSFKKTDRVFKHIDYGYASTVHASQGRTSKNVIGVMESDHKQLTDQRSFYVTLSRAKEQAFLISDSKNTLVKTLNENTGAKVSSSEHQKIPMN